MPVFGVIVYISELINFQRLGGRGLRGTYLAMSNLLSSKKMSFVSGTMAAEQFGSFLTFTETPMLSVTSNLNLK